MKLRGSVLVVGASLSTLWGCEAERNQAVANVEHPSWEIGPDFRPVPTDSAPPALLALRQALSSARLEWEIGTFDGAPETVFGNPVAVDLWSGTVYVLDAMLNEVRSFTRAGHFVDRFGRQGQGPLEFHSPRGIASTNSGQLVVGMASALKFFSRSDTGYSLIRVRRVDGDMPAPADLCTLGNTVYVYSGNLLDTDDVIFAIDSTGRGRGSFGQGYTSGSWLIRSTLSSGWIACVETPPTVVSAFKEGPLIRGFFPDGRLRWTAYVSNFRPLKWVEEFRDDVGQTFGTDSSEPGDLVLSLTSIPHGAVLFQVARLGAFSQVRGGQPIERIDSYVLSVATGRGVLVGSDLPRILHADGERLWGVRSDSLGVLKVIQLRYGDG